MFSTSIYGWRDDGGAERKIKSLRGLVRLIRRQLRMEGRKEMRWRKSGEGMQPQDQFRPETLNSTCSSRIQVLSL